MKPKCLISSVKAQFSNDKRSSYEELSEVREVLSVLRVISDSLVGTYLVNLLEPWTNYVVELCSPK